MLLRSNEGSYNLWCLRPVGTFAADQIAAALRIRAIAQNGTECMMIVSMMCEGVGYSRAHVSMSSAFLECSHQRSAAQRASVPPARWPVGVPKRSTHRWPDAGETRRISMLIAV